MTKSNNNIKKNLLLITYSIILCFFIFQFKKAMYIISIIFNIISPLLYGFIIAFILNILVKLFDRKLKVKNKNKKRLISVILTLLILSFIVVMTIILIIPQIINTIDILSKKLPNLLDNVKTIYNNFLNNNQYVKNIINKINLKNITSDTLKIINNNSNGLAFSSIHIVRNITNFVINIFLGIIISILILLRKEKVKKTINEFIKKHMTIKKYKKLLKISNITKDKFEKFIILQVLQAIIIGIISVILMLILRIPYSISISIIISVLTLIPVVGLFIATIIGLILILPNSLIKSLLFIGIVIVANFIESNFIMPKLMEKNFNVPGIIVFIVSIISGINFGILGLILCVPILSIIYELYKYKIN